MATHQLPWALDWCKGRKKNYINGEWVDSSRSFQSINPSNQQVICELAEASSAEVDLAVQAAAEAFKGNWRTLDRRERMRVLRGLGALVRENAVQLATLEALDNGKTFKEALYDDMPDSGDIFDYYAGWTDKYYGETCPVEDGFVNFTQRDPIGVCALIVPWNFPLLLAMWKIAPALAMGNTVVVKPAPYTSLSLIRFAELVDASGLLPKGVFNVVLGDVETGEALTLHRQVSKVSFTGSTAVGKKIVINSGQSNLKSVTLELGGKAPDIIFDDVPDLEGALKRSFQVMFGQKGEKCTEPTRFLIHKNIYKEFSEKLIPLARGIVCGNPFDEKTQQGAQCHQAHFEKVLSYIEIGKKEGAKLLVGGERDTTGENAKGFYVRPTIFGDVSNKMKIAQDEIFGPVLVLIPFETEEEAIEIANDSPYGLAAGLYTSNLSRAHRVAAQIDSGQVFVNHYGCYHFASPFGGVKESGWGREMGIHSLQAYTKLKSTWIKYS